MNNINLHKKYKTFFDEQYIRLLSKIYFDGIKEFNNRTKTEIKAIPQQFINVNLMDYIPVLGCRKIFPHVAAAELAWTLQGSQETAFIKKYSKMWTKFEDEPGKVLPAYGYRWRNHFGRDQFFEAIKALKEDKSNRQIWVTAWDPSQDGLSNIGKYKNVPCPLGFLLNTIGDKLNMTVIIRSSDTVVGLPYDFMMYTLLLCALAKTLEMQLGNISLLLNHAHIYSAHYNIVFDMINDFTDYIFNGEPINEVFVPQSIPIPDYDINQIIESPDKYVEDIKSSYKKVLNDLTLRPKMIFPEIIE